MNNNKNNNNKKENIMTKETMTHKIDYFMIKGTMTQEIKEFVEYFKSFYDGAKDKWITTDMIVNEVYNLKELDVDNAIYTGEDFFHWCGGDSIDRETVYDNIMEEHEENK